MAMLPLMALPDLPSSLVPPSRIGTGDGVVPVAEPAVVAADLATGIEAETGGVGPDLVVPGKVADNVRAGRAAAAAPRSVGSWEAAVLGPGLNHSHSLPL